MENNLSTSTEDKKEKETSSGGWRLKEGRESALGLEGSDQRGCEPIWGMGRRSGRPGEAAPHRGRGGCRGHGGDAQGVQDKEAGEQSWVRMRGVREETEQEEPGVTPVRRGEGGEDWCGLRFLMYHSCALQKTVSGEGWGQVQMRRLLEESRWQMTMVRTTVEAGGIERWGHTLDTFGRWSL